MTEEKLNSFFLWVDGGKMASHYAHRSAHLLLDDMKNPKRRIW
jgi:hypothetical protein